MQFDLHLSHLLVVFPSVGVEFGCCVEFEVVVRVVCSVGEGREGVNLYVVVRRFEVKLPRVE